MKYVIFLCMLLVSLGMVVKAQQDVRLKDKHRPKNNDNGFDHKRRFLKRMKKQNH